nr:ABC transporter substrate-binding protein [Occultella aeris]
MIHYEPTVRATPQLDEFGTPGTLKSVDVNEDATEFVLHLRQGLRWSDGEPVTADDVMFAIQDVFFNNTLYPTIPEFLTADDQPCTAERVDDFTVKLTYTGTRADFLVTASRGEQPKNLLGWPKHYLQDFIPDLNPEANNIAVAAGFSDWMDYWSDRKNYYDNPDLPTLAAWSITSPLNEGTVVVAERNPYYWKTDDQGAQLPFIDLLEFEIVQNDEVMLLKAVNGEIDFHARNFNNDPNRPVLADARESGDFRFVTVEPTSMNQMIIALNLNHRDAAMRSVFQNKDFRIGLSYAINRQDIIDTVYQRQGEPWQAAPHSNSDFYDEEYAKQYTEFDLELAAEHLDRAGLTETDGEGFRLRPDGQRLSFQVDVTAGTTQHIQAMSLVVQTWAEVGIQATVNTLERSLFYDRKSPSANQHDANVWGGDGGFRTEQDELRWWFPSWSESNYAVRWAEWYTSDGASPTGEEPPAVVREQMDLAKQMELESDPEERDALFRSILEIAKDQFYAIGTALPGDGYAIAKNHLRNVVDSYPESPLYFSPGHVDPPSWYFA